MIKLLDQKGLLELDSFPVNLSRYSRQGISRSDIEKICTLQG